MTFEKPILRGEKGKLYYEGVNKAADAAITMTGEDGKDLILLIQPPDGSWALPGGFVEMKEMAKGIQGDRITASKELHEETGLIIGGSAVLFEDSERIGGDEGIPVYDPRNDDISRIETALYHRHLSNEEAKKFEIKDPKVVSGLPGEDEVNTIKWFDIEDLSALELFASHKRLIEMVREKLAGINELAD